MRCYLLRFILNFISIGKYQSKLYNKGEDTQSSSCGGVTTILCGFIIVIYAALTFDGIIHRHNYNLETKSKELQLYRFDKEGRV